MIVLRCTHRVLKRFGLDAREPSVAGTDKLGCWYANLLNIGSARQVLCVSEETLLPVMIPARNSEFPARFGIYLEEVLVAIGIPTVAAAEEARTTDEYVVAKTANKSMLASMNDFVRCARHRFEEIDRLEVVLRLAEMPVGVLSWGTPQEATCKLFGVVAPPHRMLREFGVGDDAL